MKKIEGFPPFVGWYIFVLLSLLDIITTHLLLGRGDREGNPLAVMLLEHGGEPILYLVKVAAIVIIAAIGVRLRAVATVWIVNFLMFMVVFSNLSHLF